MAIQPNLKPEMEEPDAPPPGYSRSEAKPRQGATLITSTQFKSLLLPYIAQSQRVE
jgi:hypothetical protein